VTLIAFEGLDGSGKSTIAPLVAAQVGGRYVAMPPSELDLKQHALLRRQASPARYLYYLAGVAAIEHALAEDDLVICDRHLASAHALHVDTDDEVRRAFEALPLRAADGTIFLDVSEPERRARLEARPRPLDPFEQRLLVDYDLRERVRARLLMAPNILIVPTDGRTVEEVVSRSVEALDQLVGRRRDAGWDSCSPRSTR
jgi:thymidylate kinase